MEIRNVRRLFMAGKGLRIYRKKHGIILLLPHVRLLYCLFYYKSSYSASYIHALMKGQGNNIKFVGTVYACLDKLVRLGFAAKDGQGRYGITKDGRSALFEIERCIRDARPDR